MPSTQEIREILPVWWSLHESVAGQIWLQWRNGSIVVNAKTFGEGDEALSRIRMFVTRIEEHAPWH